MSVLSVLGLYLKFYENEENDGLTLRKDPILSLLKIETFHRTISPEYKSLTWLKKGKNCTGEADDVVKTPKRVGREAEITSSRALSYHFRTAATTNLFRFKCDGGCIKVDSVSIERI